MAWQYNFQRIAYPFTLEEAHRSVVDRVVDALMGQPGNEAASQGLAAEQVLNEWGRDGWELVAVITDAKGLIAILKRRFDPDD